MKEDGTINRAALPAIFNPEDLNALEQALQLKEQHPGSTVTLLTMGPPRAAEIIVKACSAVPTEVSYLPTELLLEPIRWQPLMPWQVLSVK